MTNPNNAVGTNAGFNGRSTPNAINDILAAFPDGGIVSGWGCSPKSGMTVQIGGNGTKRDVAIAKNNTGDFTTINNRLGSPIDITLDGAPSTGNRIDVIVAYVNNPQNGTGAADVDFPSQTGIIAVKGTAAGSPSEPSTATIQSAITADGGNGTTAFWTKLAKITVGQGVTTIGSGVITAADSAKTSNINIANGSIKTAMLASGAVATTKLASGAVTNDKIDWSTIDYSTTERVIGQWIDGKTLYQEVIKVSDAAKDATTDYAHGISGMSFGFIQNLFVHRPDNNAVREINTTDSTSSGSVAQLTPTNLSYRIPATTWNWTGATLDLYAIICYTK